MCSLITAAARAPAMGDLLAALERVALRDDPPALALRGMGTAELGDLTRAKELLRSAARPNKATAVYSAWSPVAGIALVSRDLSAPMQTLGAARRTLETHGDQANAAHAGYLEARWLLVKVCLPTGKIGPTRAGLAQLFRFVQQEGLRHYRSFGATLIR